MWIAWGCACYLSSAGATLTLSQTWGKITQGCANFTVVNPPCIAALTQASLEIGAVNIYDIYAPCINGASAGSGNGSVYAKTGMPKLPVGGPDECIDSIAASAYLNQASVMAALHVQPAPSGPWSVCGNVIDYTSTVKDEPKTIYPTLIKHYHVMIFNGDADGCVPYIDNEAWCVWLQCVVWCDAAQDVWDGVPCEGGLASVAG